MIAFDGLAYHWAGGPALRFGRLDAPQGAQVLVRGDSGSGKSTLLALLAGLLTPTAGTLQVAGTAPAALPARRRDAWRGATLGFVPQRLHLSDSLSVWHNLALPYVACGEAVDDARIGQLLQRLGLGALAARRPHQLSVGQAQRVALARALLRRPQVLLADEPSAHLDDRAAAAAIALLREVALEQGATLLVATHDTRVVAALPQAQTLRLQCPTDGKVAA